MKFEDILLSSYFDYNSLVNQQIKSYNNFIEHKMQEIVDNVGVIETNVEGFSIRLGKIRVEPPKFYEVTSSPRIVLPTEAKIRNITYSSPVRLAMIPSYNGIEKKMYSDVYIGDIPVMVKSNLCHTSRMSKEELIDYGLDPMDPGGYFIINGTERVLISLEDLVPNKILVTLNDDGTIISKIFSKRNNFRARTVVRRSKEGIWYVEFPAIPVGIMLLTLIRALGFEKDSDIIDLFEIERHCVENDLYYNLDNLKGKDERPDEYLAKRISPGQPKEYQLNRMNYVIDNYLLPHLGIEAKDRKKKAVFLVRMAKRATLLYNKKLLPDDKDFYGNKRIKLAGDLMVELFNYAFNFLVKDIIYQVSRANVRGRKLQVHTLVRQNALTDRILYSMATGNWIAGQTGVSQLLDRVSFVSSLSHRRRLISPLSKKHPHFKARDLHGTQYGRICPSETPEGPPTSLVKNFALLSELSSGTDEESVERIIREIGIEEVE